MEIRSMLPMQAGDAPFSAMSAPALAPKMQAAKGDLQKEREAFDSFVGETFYSQMLSSMRKTQDKPAYFHGGRAEEVFQGQLDQTLAAEMTKASAAEFTGPMFELFQLSRA